MKQNKNMLKKACMFGLACMVAASTANVTTVVTHAENTTGTEAKTASYKVGVQQTEGGTVSAKVGEMTLTDGEVFANPGQEVVFHVEAQDGYEFKAFKCDGNDMGLVPDENGNITVNIWYNATFSAEFAKRAETITNYRIGVQQTEGGIVTATVGENTLTDGEVFANPGQEAVFHVEAQDGYEFRAFKCDGNDMGLIPDENGNITVNIWYNATFSAEFAKKEEVTTNYKFGVQQTKGGVLTATVGEMTLTDGEAFANPGQEVVFHIEAQDGYEFRSFKLDGNDMGLVPDANGDIKVYVWYNGTFSAEFAKKADVVVKDQYKFGLRSDENGSLTYGTSDGDIFLKADTYTFTVKANDGYELDKIYNQDGADVTGDIVFDENGNFEWRVAYDGYLTATFKEVKHHEGWRWGLQSDGNGTVSCEELGYDGGEKFVEQKEYTFKISPNTGYELDKLYLITEGNEVDVTADAKVAEDGTFAWTVAYDGALKATFKEIVKPEEPTHEGWRWGLQSDGNGVIRCEELGYDGGEKFVDEAEYTFQILPNEGYELDKLYLITEDGNLVDVTEDAEIEEDGTFTWTVAYDGTLKATFKEAAAPDVPVTPEDPTKPEEPAKPEDTKKPETTSTDKKEKKDKNDKKAESKKESSTPKTGDTAPIATATGVSVAALAAAAVVVRKRKTVE